MSLFTFFKNFFSASSPDKNKPKSAPPPEKDFVGDIEHYYGKVNAAVLKIKNGNLSVGETIRICGTHVDFTQKVIAMQIDHKPITTAKKGQVIGLEVMSKVHEHDRVYRVPAA